MALVAAGDSAPTGGYENPIAVDIVSIVGGDLRPAHRGVGVCRLGQLRISSVRTTTTTTSPRRWRRRCRKPTCLPMSRSTRNGSSGANFQMPLVGFLL
jgi:hypothetical protein